MFLKRKREFAIFAIVCNLLPSQFNKFRNRTVEVGLAFTDVAGLVANTSSFITERTIHDLFASFSFVVGRADASEGVNTVHTRSVSARILRTVVNILGAVGAAETGLWRIVRNIRIVREMGANTKSFSSFTQNEISKITRRFQSKTSHLAFTSVTGLDVGTITIVLARRSLALVDILVTVGAIPAFLAGTHEASRAHIALSVYARRRIASIDLFFAQRPFESFLKRQESRNMKKRLQYLIILD